MTKKVKRPQANKSTQKIPIQNKDSEKSPVEREDETRCRYCSEPIAENAKVCHSCGCDQRWWIQPLGNTTLVASIVISAFMLIMSYLQFSATEKKDRAATEALQQAKDALAVAQQTGSELAEARQGLLDLATVTGTTMLTDLMAANFNDSTTLATRVKMHDEIIASLRRVGLGEEQIQAADSMWRKGVGVIYFRGIRVAFEGRQYRHKINMDASPELRRASKELEQLLEFEGWQAPTPDEIESFIEDTGFMNEKVKNLIADYRHFVETGDIRNRGVFEGL